MKNKAIVILSILCCTVVFTACSSNNTEESSQISEVPISSSESSFEESSQVSVIYESELSLVVESELSDASHTYNFFVPESYDDITPIQMNREEWDYNVRGDSKKQYSYGDSEIDPTYVKLNKYLGSAENVTIPNVWTGDSGNTYKVKLIDIGAFKDNQTIKEVIVSEGIEEIADNCFLNCENLEAVWLPSTIKKIGLYSLTVCPNLKKVYYYKNTAADPESSKSVWEIDDLYRSKKVEFISLGEVKETE